MNENIIILEQCSSSAIANGDWSESISFPVSHDTSVTYSCREGYEGNGRSTCKNGDLENPPQCKPGEDKLGSVIRMDCILSEEAV